MGIVEKVSEFLDAAASTGASWQVIDARVFRPDRNYNGHIISLEDARRRIEYPVTRPTTISDERFDELVRRQPKLHYQLAVGKRSIDVHHYSTPPIEGWSPLYYRLSVDFAGLFDPNHTPGRYTPFDLELKPYDYLRDITMLMWPVRTEGVRPPSFRLSQMHLHVWFDPFQKDETANLPDDWSSRIARLVSTVLPKFKDVPGFPARAQTSFDQLCADFIASEDSCAKMVSEWNDDPLPSYTHFNHDVRAGIPYKL